jgi:hypothetical protein
MRARQIVHSNLRIKKGCGTQSTRKHPIDKEYLEGRARNRPSGPQDRNPGLRVRSRTARQSAMWRAVSDIRKSRCCPRPPLKEYECKKVTVATNLPPEKSVVEQS